jgi:alkanesulfonate monooxygenase SsuD/methylene tetrahydromethanopterin reductase-like flavin-dependent oxidoreductase (luciferase family)
VLSKGRAVWGMGRSTPMEQIAFGVDIPDSKNKVRAAARSVVGMWEQEYYEEHSEYLDFPARMVTPKPYQYPHPPCWMAGVSEESIRLAGQNALGLLCFSIMQPLDKLASLIDAYREEQKNAVPLTSVATNKVGVYTLVHCSESRAKFDTNRVWDSLWWWYASSAEFILKWEMSHLSKEDQDKAFPLLKKQAEGGFDLHAFDEQDMVIIGTPDECLKKFLKYEEAGVDQVLCYINFGYLPQDAVLECINLLGDYVIPELKAMGAKRTAQGIEQSITAQQAAK